MVLDPSLKKEISLKVTLTMMYFPIYHVIVDLLNSFLKDIAQRVVPLLHHGCCRRPISNIFRRSASLLFQGELD
jgi:hypothetical protein